MVVEEEEEDQRRFCSGWEYQNFRGWKQILLDVISLESKALVGS